MRQRRRDEPACRRHVDLPAVDMRHDSARRRPRLRRPRLVGRQHLEAPRVFWCEADGPDRRVECADGRSGHGRAAPARDHVASRGTAGRMVVVTHRRESRGERERRCERDHRGLMLLVDARFMPGPCPVDHRSDDSPNRKKCCNDKRGDERRRIRGWTRRTVEASTSPASARLERDLRPSTAIASSIARSCLPEMLQMGELALPRFQFCEFWSP
jgi:hypothetical protein